MARVILFPLDGATLALASEDPAEIAKLNAFSRDRQVPFYSNVFKFYGPEEVVRAQRPGCGVTGGACRC